MNIDVAIIKDNICIDVAVFDLWETAQLFFDMGIWPNADKITKLPDGYGVGDNFVSGNWVKQDTSDPDIDIDALRNAKLEEINNACQQTIHNGIDIKTSIGIKHFNMSDQDQINLLAYRAEAVAAMAGFPAQIDLDQGIWYKADSPGDAHRYWSIEDFMFITNALIKFKVEQLTYCDMLKSYVRELDDAQDINAVYYGMEL